MINKLTKYKMVFVCVAFLALTYCIFLRLAKYQIIDHEEIAATSLRKTTRTYTQDASRGIIMDRNGVSLVSNEMGFELVFDYFTWDKTLQNEVILQLSALMDRYSQPYMNTLPIILDGSDYQFTTVDEADRNYKKLMQFLEKTKGFSKDMSSREVMGAFGERYKTDPALSPGEKLTVARVRYDMEQQNFSSYTPYIYATEVPLEIISKVSEATMFFPGVNVSETEKRRYDTDSAAHILGRVGVIYKDEYEKLKEEGYPLNAIIGKDGVEKVFESYLRPISGVLGMETNIDGDFTQAQFIKEPQPGKNVVLTLDIGLQEATEKALADVIENIRNNSKTAKNNTGADVAGGAAVVIDVNTGEILACASAPTYSLKTFNADYNMLNSDPLTPMFNRALMWECPPGSIFKMATSLAVLEEGIVTPTTIIRDEGIYKYYYNENPKMSYTPGCWIYNQLGRTHGNVDVSGAIKHSCNYFFYETSRIMGIEKLNEYAKKLGLGSYTGVELPEKKGNLAGPESRAARGGGIWYPSETIQAAIGQSEQQFTPLQLANYIATIVNGGTRYKPHFLKEIRAFDSGETLEAPQPEIVDTIEMKASTLEAIKKGMLDATTDDGTASSTFKNYPIKIGAKTGSVQTKKGASAHGSFLSFAPYDNPEIAVCVIIQHGGSGGSVAPAVRDIYDHYFNLNQENPIPNEEIVP